MPEPKARILIVDDDDIILDSLQEFLRLEGYQVDVARSYEEAIGALERAEFNIAITDVNMPGSSGFELLRLCRQKYPQMVVVMITGYGTIDSAVEAIKMGAYDYLTKPIIDDELRLAVERALQQQNLLRENRALKQQLEQRHQLTNIVGQDYKMLRVFDLIESVADSRTNVLILGESGTGKSMIARAIHAHSRRADRPFIEVACGAIPESLLESELFGHVRGAFTGAVADRKGLLEAADGGTIFLDEIGDMPMSMQAKLLRALENGEILPVGSNEVRHTDVRVIAATHRDLRERMKEGQFREDLYYRLNQVMIRIPPLRERREDIPLLIQHFIEQANAEHGCRVQGITPEAIRQLVNQRWEGNVRQLRQAITQMVVLASEPTLDVGDIPEEFRQNTQIIPVSSGFLAGHTLTELEKVAIQQTLKLTDGNREKAAKLLGIGARTLYRKLKEYDIEG